jgi:type II secretory pathway pseudopilin PulG
VVIAIIAILIGLLVPAVQKVRGAAARIQCANNLHQLGLACHLYNDAHNKLPPGWVTTTANKPSPGWSWATVILPYVEQNSLYTQVNPDETGRKFPAADPPNMIDEARQVLPANFNTRFTLTADVKPRVNVIDFPLTSK